MSVELINVLITVLAVGAILAVVIQKSRLLICLFMGYVGTGAPSLAQPCCTDRDGNGMLPFPSRSVRRCVRTQAVRARSLCSGLFGRVGSP